MAARGYNRKHRNGKYSRVKKSKKSRKVPKGTRRQIKKVLYSLAETKRIIERFSVGLQYTHNSWNVIDQSIYYTTKGVRSGIYGGATDLSANSQTIDQRIGDEILPTSCLYKIFLQNNERFGTVHHRFMCIKGPYSITPTKADIFELASGITLMNDIKKTGSFTVIYDRTVTLTAGVPGFNANQGGQIDYTLVGSGTYGTDTGESGVAFQPGSRLLNLRIPTPKKIKYQNGTDYPDFVYTLCYMPYVVQNTSTTLNVATINEMVKIVKFKDF
jgi:hypothetical protein